MPEQEFRNEVNYQVTKHLLFDMKEKGILSDDDIKRVLEVIKGKYAPLYEL